MDIADFVNIFPYENIAIKDWETYENDEGNTVCIPEAWRNIGFQYLYPNSVVSNDLHNCATVEELAKDLSHRLIKKMLYKNPDTGEIEETPMDKDSAEWLYMQFCVSKFLLDGAYHEYVK